MCPNIYRRRLVLLSLALLLGPLVSACDDKSEGNHETLAQCNCKEDQCISLQTRNEQPVTLTGTATIGTYEVFGKEYKPYILKLDKWLCVFGDPSRPEGDLDRAGANPVKEIQLAGNFNTHQVLNNLTRRVQAQGQVFMAFSPWHIGSVIFIPSSDITPAP